MVVFSLQTFINTFFYVQSSGWARQAAPVRRPKQMASAGQRKRTAANGQPLRPTGCGYQLPPDGLSVHPADGRKGERPRGATDARHLDA
jgi:hypothetical protein